ncbi:hypothetical protein [Georgenia satyanarayanai]|uniref:hypothetical protein n=1 Tax=Georgenia satyanarayanai TaxID=860221 RepID=UPI00126579F2|nr:hypothetical protein [Georgenia satyanarayanai]
MDDDARVPLSGAQLLASFFASAPSASHPAVRGRVPRVRAHLLTYLDTEAEAWLTPDELVLVGAERQLEPQDAVVRVTGVEVVVAALPGFCHPAWLLPAALDARAQLRLVAGLRQWAAEHGGLSAQAAMHLLPRVDEAVRRAQASLNGSPAP